MTRPWRQYAALSILLLVAGSYHAANLAWVFRTLSNPGAVPSAPFSIQAATRKIGTSPFYNDQILALNGRPFTAKRQLNDIMSHAHPGDTLHLVLSEPSGRAIERSVVIGSQIPHVRSASQIALLLCLNVLIPLVCLSLGFAVTFIRPRDGNAWLLLLFLICFAGLIISSEWYSPLPDLTLICETFFQGTWTIWLMLFAIHFPSRSALDRRKPWLKHLVIVPTIVVQAMFWGIAGIWLHSIAAAEPLRPLFTKLYLAVLVSQMMGVGSFFSVLGRKSGTEVSPDDRRRLRILRTGAGVSLAPMFVIVLTAIVRDKDLLAGVPWPIEVFALSMMGLLPLTFAYVIVVGRAMDLGFVVRQSVKYGLARGGLWLVRASALGLVIYTFSAGSKHGVGPLFLVVAGVGVAIVRRRNTDRASAWIDRKFFREAYNTEAVLGELATEVSRYLETGPLVEVVAHRVPAILHVPDVVVLLRERDVYRTRYSTRPGEPMDIAAGGNIVAALRESGAPLDVYFDKPPDWIRGLEADELQTLDFMRTQLLLPIPGKEQLAGIMSLGPKLSEEAYSTTDRRLLQAVTMQMGMALENSRLMASLAEATAQREVINRELEIAREVQERLFPQKFPKLPGIDCCGYCRPARGVGGDYYDFIELPEGRLGIAIGDVSGKGIAAALLMASLQASLRGQTMAGIHDLAGLMRNVNKLVYDASQSNRYATFFYAEFDPATSRLFYVNAGHNPPIVLRGSEVLRLDASGPVVGLLPGVGYSMDVCELRPGDIFVGYTDGISEAMNEQDEEWEEERFIAAARFVAELHSKEMIEGIFRKADEFTGAAKQYDDMTLLVMKLAG